jgi:hypothetical protein
MSKYRVAWVVETYDCMVGWVPGDFFWTRKQARECQRRCSDETRIRKYVPEEK